MRSFLKGLFARARASSFGRHFFYTFLAVFVLGSIPVVQNVGDAMVQGKMLTGDEWLGLAKAAYFALGTAILRVVVPALVSLAGRAERS